MLGSINNRGKVSEPCLSSPIITLHRGTFRRGAERCKIVLEIQKKQGSQWITVDSWSVEKDGRNANLSKSVEAKKGTTYRAKVKVTVWLDGKSETKTITTSGKTA